MNNKSLARILQHARANIVKVGVGWYSATGQNLKAYAGKYLNKTSDYI